MPLVKAVRMDWKWKLKAKDEALIGHSDQYQPAIEVPDPAP